MYIYMYLSAFIFKNKLFHVILLDVNLEINKILVIIDLIYLFYIAFIYKGEKIMFKY